MSTTAVPPRAFGIAELLDGAFTLYRRNFAAFFGAALVPQVPLIALWLILAALVGTGPGARAILGLTIFPAALFGWAMSALVWGALVWAAHRAFEGAAPSAGDALRQGLRTFIPVLVTATVTWILIFVGLIALVIPGLLLVAMFFAVVPAVVLEGRGPLEALARSRRLSKGGRTRALVVLTIATLITFLPGVAFYMLVGVSVGVGSLFAGDPTALAESGWVGGLLQGVAIVVTALTTPFLVAVVTLLYVDRRARTDAADLEAAAERLTATHA